MTERKVVNLFMWVLILTAAFCVKFKVIDYGAKSVVFMPSQVTTEEIHLTPTVVLTAKEEPKPKIVKIVQKVKSYLDLPLPIGDSPKDYQALFLEIERLFGVPHKTLAKFAALESSFDSRAHAKSTGAKGLFQFTNAHWAHVISKHDEPYGINTEVSAYDPRAASVILALSLKDNAKLLHEKLNIKSHNASNLYVVHLLGRTGAVKFFKSKPTTKMALKMPKAARYNKPLFYKKGKVLTQHEVKAVITHRLTASVSSFDLNA